MFSSGLVDKENLVFTKEELDKMNTTRTPLKDIKQQTGLMNPFRKSVCDPTMAPLSLKSAKQKPHRYKLVKNGSKGQTDDKKSIGDGRESDSVEVKGSEISSPAVLCREQLLESLSNPDLDVPDRDVDHFTDLLLHKCLSTIQMKQLLADKPVLADIGTSPMLAQGDEHLEIINRCLQLSPKRMSVGCSPFLLPADPIFKDKELLALPDIQHKSTMTVKKKMKDSEMCTSPTITQTKLQKKFSANEIRRMHPKVVAGHFQSIFAHNELLQAELRKAKKATKDIESQLQYFKIQNNDAGNQKDGKQLPVVQLQHFKIQDKGVGNQKDSKQLPVVEVDGNLDTLSKDKERYASFIEHKFDELKKELLKVNAKCDQEITQLCSKCTDLKEQVLNRKLDLPKEQTFSTVGISPQWVVNQVFDFFGEWCSHVDRSQIGDDSESILNILSQVKTAVASQKHNADISMLKCPEHEAEKTWMEKETELVKKLECVQLGLEQREKDLHTEKQRYGELSSKLQHTVALMEEQSDRYELVIRNLQATIESEEHDFDVLQRDLMTYRNIIVEQRQALDKSKEEIEKKCRQLMELDDMKNQMASLQKDFELLSSKKRALQSTVSLLQDKIDTTEKARAYLSQLNNEQLRRCKQLENQIQELKNELSLTEEELENIRTNATRMLRRQSTELQDASTALCELKKRLQKMLQDLQKKAEMEDNANAGHSSKSTLPHSPNQSLQQSLQNQSIVTSIIEAVKEAKVTAAVNNSPVRSDCILDSISQENCSSPKPNPFRCSTVNLLEHNSRKNSSDGDEDLLVDEIIYQISVVDQIVHVARVIEKSTLSHLEDLKSQNNFMVGELKYLEKKGKRLQSEIALRDEKLKTVEFEKDYLSERLESLIQSLASCCEQQMHNKELTEEVQLLKKHLNSVKKEKKLIQEEYEKLANRSAGFGKVSSDITDNLVLKTKVLQMQEKLEEEEKSFSEFWSNVSTRMEIIEENWKSAEAEVYRFDKLVDTIKQVLLKEEYDVCKIPGVNLLIQLIDKQLSPEELLAKANI